MQNKSRLIAAAAAGALLLSGCAQVAPAANAKGAPVAWPSGGKTLTIIIGYDAGASTDTGVRLLVPGLEKELGMTIVVENRPGAGGQIGYTAVSQARADGYTIGTANLPAYLQIMRDESRGASYTIDDFAPVANMMIDPLAIAVPFDSPYDSIDDLIDAAKASPGTITATTSGIGGGDHLAILAMEQATGIDLAPVHFTDGSAAVAAAFAGGHVDVLSGNIGGMAALVQNDQAKILGVISKERSPLFPDALTMEEQGIDAELESSTRGLIAPSGVDDEIIAKISAAVEVAMQDEEYLEKMAAQGLATEYMTSKEYGEHWDQFGTVLDALAPLIEQDK